MPATISDQAISYSLSAKLNDTFTFTPSNGHEISVRILPRVRPDGKLTVYESWERVKPSRLCRLLTERGYEIVFDLPFLFEYHLEQSGYPSDAATLLERFFEAMKGSEFKFYPRELFK